MDADFPFLIVLGVCTACISFFMDVLIDYMVIGKLQHPVEKWLGII